MKVTLSAASILGLVACMSIPAEAIEADETTPPAPATSLPAPCSEPVYHQFDFWIGEWDVFDPAGNLAGTNSIQPAETGCLLIERWTNTAGGTGQSYNFYDPGIGKWRQIWVSPAGVIDYSGGLTDTGAMFLEGEIRNRGAGGVAPFTGEWTANADGSVTQHFRQQDPVTGEWSDWFVGRYVRKSGD